MAITEVRIHPAIGIARVGNSDSEFFIGPSDAGSGAGIGEVDLADPTAGIAQAAATGEANRAG